MVAPQSCLSSAEVQLCYESCLWCYVLRFGYFECLRTLDSCVCGVFLTSNFVSTTTVVVSAYIKHSEVLRCVFGLIC